MIYFAPNISAAKKKNKKVSDIHGHLNRSRAIDDHSGSTLSSSLSKCYCGLVHFWHPYSVFVDAPAHIYVLATSSYVGGRKSRGSGKAKAKQRPSKLSLDSNLPRRQTRSRRSSTSAGSENDIIGKDVNRSSSSRHGPPSTPDGFWNLTFINSDDEGEEQI